jgi:tetratricopeptide (TPR) repeat protein
LTQIARTNPSNLTVDEALYIAPRMNNAQDRIKVYQAAADKYGDARAYNNLAVEQAKAGMLDAAAASLKAASQKGSDPVIGENMGMMALANGDTRTAKDVLSKLSSPEAKSALAFATGDYTTASKGLTGYNLAVAQLCNGNVAAAKSTLASVPATGGSEYLKAVIASREGDVKNAVSSLKSAIGMDSSLADKAKKDAEFSTLLDSPEFKALLR